MGEANLPVKLQKVIRSFIEDLSSLYKEDLVSVILYGSAASGEYVGVYSNVNIAVFLKDAQLKNIAKSSRLMRKYCTISPTFFTEKFIRSSADVFPIEFLDMKENHLVLYGPDLFKDLEIDIRNLRFQCEQELKAKIINMKKSYIETGAASSLRNILFKFFGSALHILRNVVRLKGRTPPYKKDDIITELSVGLGIDVTNMRAIQNAKIGKTVLKNKDVENLFFEFANDLEAISEIIDKS
ncbi:MAG: hypothetical protein WCY36_01900 [Candidatus Omnitrophota bacterium]